jgi:hypothetical protein
VTPDEERALLMLEMGYHLGRHERLVLLRLVDRRLGLNRHPRSWVIYVLPLAFYERIT